MNSNKMDRSKFRAALFVGLILCATLASAAQVPVQEAGGGDDVNNDKAPNKASEHQQQQQSTTETAESESGRVAEKCEEAVLMRDPVQSLIDELWEEARSYWAPSSAINSMFMGPAARRGGRYIPRAYFGDMLSDMGSRMTRAMRDEGRRGLVDSVSLRTIANDEKEAVFAVKLAGVPRENVTISVDSEGLLMVDAKHNEKTPDGAEHEYSYVAQRQLPFGVNADDVKAEYKDGLLRITVPKPVGERVTKVAIQ